MAQPLTQLEMARVLRAVKNKVPVHRLGIGDMTLREIIATVVENLQVENG